MFESLLRDMRGALRAAAAARGVTALAVLTLALGIGATTTMFSVVDAALLRPVPFARADRLAMLYVTRTNPRDGTVRLRWSRPIIGTLERTLSKAPESSFATIASVSGANITIAGGDGDAEQIEGELVSPAYFRTLGIAPVFGRLFRDDEDTAPNQAPVAMLGDTVWHQRFHSDPGIVGKTVRINDTPLIIVGVLPPGFAGVTGRSTIWIPRAMAPLLTYADYLTTPQHFISVVARLRDAATFAAANAELAARAPELADERVAPDTVWGAAAIPIGEARIDSAVRRSVLLLLTAAVCVLAIGCLNVACLLLARGRARRHEFAVRLALGAGRGRLVRLLLTEGFVLALCAGVVGTLVSLWTVDVLARTAPGIAPSMRNDYAAVGAFAVPKLDLRVLLFAFAATLATTLCCSLAPALHAAWANVGDDLKADERGGRQYAVFSVAVVFEVAIAVLLVTSAGLLIESASRINGRRVGFTADNVLTFWIRPPSSRYPPQSGPAILDRILTRIERVPGVEAAAVNRCVPFTGCSRTVAFFPDRAAIGMPPMVGRHYTSPDYFRALGIPLVAGRSLSDDDRPGRPPVAVVNETGARRFWPGENPLGKRVWFGTTTGPFSDPAHAVEIVGVVGDVKYEGVEQVDPNRADFYTSFRQFAYPDSMVVVKARGATSTLLPSLRAAIAEVDTSTPIFDVQSLDERIDGATARPRFNATIVAAFAGTALLLAAIGVYGILSYAVSARMRELGIRLALGADPRRLLTVVLTQGVRVAVVGGLCGIAGTFAVARLMQSLLVDVAATDVKTLAAAFAATVAAAAVAAFVPARRAAAVDPLTVLRHE
jgi:predicted permease